MTPRPTMVGIELCGIGCAAGSSVGSITGNVVECSVGVELGCVSRCSVGMSLRIALGRELGAATLDLWTQRQQEFSALV